MSSCIDHKKLDGKLVIMDGRLYELQNRFGTGYWFVEKPFSDTLILKITVSAMRWRGLEAQKYQNTLN